MELCKGNELNLPKIQVHGMRKTRERRIWMCLDLNQTPRAEQAIRVKNNEEESALVVLARKKKKKKRSERRGMKQRVDGYRGWNLKNFI